MGVAGGLALLAAFIPWLPWDAQFTNLRIVLFNTGAIAIAVAVQRRLGAGSGRGGRAVVAAAILANAWYLAMVVLSIGRPQPPQGDPEFRLVGFYAGVAMWWADAALGYVSWRLGVVSRWGGMALAIGSVLVFLGMDRLELVRGDLSWLFTPVALVGGALNGVGWVLLGIGVAVRRPALGLRNDRSRS
jgi:hypothetical protein